MSQGSCAHVLLTYAKGQKRDQHCSRIISKLTNGNQIIVEFKDDDIGHDVFQSLVELGGLKAFLDRTIYAKLDNGLIEKQRVNAVLKLPENKINLCG